jgi:predicted secreted protein
MRVLVVVIAAWFIVLGCAVAAAGDSATFAPIGYSEDNRYFAYEQFSIGDEGTQPFASVALVDLTTGAAVPGSPWTANGSEEVADTVTALRLEAIELATEALTEAGIGDPGHFLALIGDGMRSKGDRLTFALPQGADPDALGPDITLDVVLLPALREDRCTPDFGGGTIDFVLVLSSEGMNRQLRHNAVVDADDCIRRYRLYGVLQPYNGGDVASLVAVVSVYTVGFEGYDRRFMVIPLGANP